MSSVLGKGVQRTSGLYWGTIDLFLNLLFLRSLPMDALHQGSFHRFRPLIPSSMKKPLNPKALFVGPVPSIRCGIRCGLRGGPRQPLWRHHVLSTEAIQAVQALKLAKSLPVASDAAGLSGEGRMSEVFRGRISRLLKADLLDVFKELQRQNEWEIALQVFAFIKKEVWYKPSLSLYGDMILLLGKNKLIEIAEELFYEIEKVGVQPDTRAYTEIIGAFLHVGMVEKAMNIYHLMKASGCSPDKLTFTILIRNLENVGEEDLAVAIRSDCEQYLDSPEKFLEEVDKKYPKRRSLKLV
ncbi:Pentatricopeptide repeat-containing protein [Apostasia shenzhenica]|uniref:Pentatricopeptide repeat-containing protein n=1 Tax=Apostasia shenzhenica TaxID=1088818 RepID=A0A2I0AL37_9ASPA|nr:Pentatricopeptide repeat-containing protein [Apostasia shenzhenica]